MTDSDDWTDGYEAKVRGEARIAPIPAPSAAVGSPEAAAWMARCGRWYAGWDHANFHPPTTGAANE